MADADMRELVKAGWAPKKILLSSVVGAVSGMVLIAAFGIEIMSVIFGIFLALVTVAYIFSLLFVRYTAKGQAAWREKHPD